MKSKREKPAVCLRGFGARLQSAITRRGLPLAEVCRLSGMQQNMLCSYRRGNVFPLVGSAVRLAELLRVRPLWLITGEGPRRPAPRRKASARPAAGAEEARLQGARRVAGLTREALAVRSGVCVRTIQNLESRVRDARLPSVVKLAAALRVPVTKLLG